MVGTSVGAAAGTGAAAGSMAGPYGAAIGLWLVWLLIICLNVKGIEKGSLSLPCGHVAASGAEKSTISVNFEEGAYQAIRLYRRQTMAIKHRIRADGNGRTKVITLTARRAIIEHCRNVLASIPMKSEDVPQSYVHCFLLGHATSQKIPLRCQHRAI